MHRKRRLIRSGVVAHGGRVPIYKNKHARRQVKFGRKTKRKLINFLGDKFSFKVVNDTLEANLPGNIDGDFVFGDFSPLTLWNVYNHVLEQCSRRYAQGGYTEQLTAGAFRGLQSQNLYVTRFNFFNRVTNICNTPVVVRFTEWQAKRDIPASFSSNAGTPPIGQLLINFQTYAGTVGADPRNAQGQGDSQFGRKIFSSTASTFYVYNFYRNQPWTWPALKYYFRFKPNKEVRIEPGAYADYQMNYTPRMAIGPNIWNQWNAGNANFNGDTVTNPNGIFYWKGLNDRGIMIELCGINGITTEGGVVHAGKTISSVLINTEQSVDCVLQPPTMSVYKAELGLVPSAYTEIVDQNLTHADETIPTITTTTVTV